MKVDSTELGKYIKEIRGTFESSLKALVDIPSVSVDPEHKADVERCAQFGAELLRSIGAKATVVPTQGHPAVMGELIKDPNCPTVALYHHLDVQPADADEWKSPPFDMTVDNGIYSGRGSTDDKGPALTGLYAVLWASRHNLPLNFKFIWELEEEIGSRSFASFLKSNKDHLQADSVLVSDTIWISRDCPAIPYGLRGLQGMLLRLKTGVKDVHSGLAGGLARNPIGELCQLIADLYDARTGKVKIPGFYDSVRPSSQTELSNFQKSGFTVDGFIKSHELSSVRTQDPLEAVQRIWSQPTFELHGITGGYSGPGIKTIVPYQAEAKISMRLVPDQDPAKIMELVTSFVKKLNADVEVIPQDSLRPYLGDLSGRFAQAACTAMTEAFGKQPAFVREGGSIGAAVTMHEVLKAPVIFLGLSLPEHGYHSVNECYDWQQASGGIKMLAHYFCELCN